MELKMEQLWNIHYGFMDITMSNINKTLVLVVKQMALNLTVRLPVGHNA